MDSATDKSSAEIEREIETDRQRIGERIDAIQQRLSPGQMIDEVLQYAKGSGGAEYLGNLGQAVKNNPIPLALMGVSIAWMMADKTRASASPEPALREPDLPLYTVDGQLRRMGPPEYDGTSRYSHFSDNTGRRFKALTDEAGNRAGHFVDEAGSTYRGFVQAGGRQIDSILDETGSALDAATGWASSSWSAVKDFARQAGQQASDTASSLSDRASSAGSMVRDQSAQLNEAILRHFRDQPLVGGALAFAVGAAIGAALPATDVEDAAVGDLADQAKDAGRSKAAELYEDGKHMAEDALGKTVSVVADVHEAARDRVSAEFGDSKTTRNL